MFFFWVDGDENLLINFLWPKVCDVQYQKSAIMPYAGNKGQMPLLWFFAGGKWYKVEECVFIATEESNL